MSVLECDRVDCGNIMCDNLSHVHGYLCNDCLDELSAIGPTDVRHFMKTPPRNSKDNNWDEIVREEFKDQCRSQA